MFKGFVKSVSKKLKLQPDKLGEGLQMQRTSSIKLKDVLKKLETEDLTNFLWLSILKSEQPFNSHTLSILRRIDQIEAQQSLKILALNKLLVEYQDSEYYIHESLRVFASHLLTSQASSKSEIKRLGIKWIDAHQKLILSFQNREKNITDEKEIYFLKNLDWHLQEAHWDEKIHSIISHTFPLNHWENQLSQDIVNCSSDSITLIRIAEKDSEINFKHNSCENLLLLSKYKLMRSLESHALKNIPVQWVKVLVETENWSKRRIIDYVQSQPGSKNKAKYIDILKDILHPNSLDILVDVIQEINLDEIRSEAINRIFRKLGIQSKKRVLLLINEIKSDIYRSICLGSIAPDIPVPLMHTAFISIKRIKDPQAQATALEKFLPYFTIPLKKKSLELIKKIEDHKDRFRLLSKLYATFPQIKSDILDLAQSIETDYTKISVLWKLQDRHNQTSTYLKALFESCDSKLDKVLFLGDLISEASPNQLEDLWDITSSFEDESLWASSIPEILPLVDSEKINQIIARLSKCKSEEIQSELCIQIFPFACHIEQYENLYRIIQDIQEPIVKGITTSQILDYIPKGISDVIQILDKITDPIKKLEIKVHLLEHDIEWGEEILSSIQKISNETLKTQFLSQVIYLLPDYLIQNTLRLILNLKEIQNRDTLLNQLTPRLEINEIKKTIYQLNQSSYPTDLLKNNSKQINRQYWETNVKFSELKLPQEIIDQLPKIEENSQKISTAEVLQDIFELPSTSNRSQILSLCIAEIQWNEIQPETLLQIVTILSQGDSLELLKNFPILTQGIEIVLGSQSLPAYGNLCYQLSQSSLIPNPSHVQNKANISRIAESQEFWPEIA